MVHTKQPAILWALSHILCCRLRVRVCMCAPTQEQEFMREQSKYIYIYMNNTGEKIRIDITKLPNRPKCLGLSYPLPTTRAPAFDGALRSPILQSARMELMAGAAL